jgi:tRNA pseudouridine38-40 synthase
MSRYFLELAYKGTVYSGFQVQENARTVQSELEAALQVFFRESFVLTGSSRTDAGVHALQNYFHFDTDIVIQPRNVYNLNAILPPDISVKGIYPVPDEAHCRFDALAREYCYNIYSEKDPFLDDRAWLYPYPLDVDLLNQAAQVLQQYEDFTSFSKRNTQVNNFRCRILESEWFVEEEKLVYRVKANRFLRGMVRGLVGTMLRVGRGQTGVEGFRAVIEAKDCSKADFSTPARGLFLKRVYYPEPLAAVLEKEDK